MILRGIRKEYTDVEVSKEELMNAIYDNVDFKELVGILEFKFIRNTDKSAEFIENNTLIRWEECRHGGDSKKIIRGLTEDEYKIYMSIIELNKLLEN